MHGIASNRLNTRLFFVLVFSLSWGFWVLAALSSTKGETLPTRLFHYAGGLMPVAVTIALIYLRHTPDFQRNFWQRVIEFKRIRIGWYAVIMFAVPILTALGAIVDVILEGEGLKLEAADIAPLRSATQLQDQGLLLNVS